MGAICSVADLRKHCHAQAPDLRTCNKELLNDLRKY